MQGDTIDCLMSADVGTYRLGSPRRALQFWISVMGGNCVFGGDVDQEAAVVRDVEMVIESRVGAHGRSRFK